jgi:hypothetical protein
MQDIVFLMARSVLAQLLYVQGGFVDSQLQSRKVDGLVTKSKAPAVRGFIQYVAVSRNQYRFDDRINSPADKQRQTVHHRHIYVGQDDIEIGFQCPAVSRARRGQNTNSYINLP